MTKQYEVTHGPVYFRVNGAMNELNIGDVVTLDEAAASGLIKRGWIKAKAQPKSRSRSKAKPAVKKVEEGE